MRNTGFCDKCQVVFYAEDVWQHQHEPTPDQLCEECNRPEDYVGHTRYTMDSHPFKPKPSQGQKEPNYSPRIVLPIPAGEVSGIPAALPQHDSAWFVPDAPSAVARPELWPKCDWCKTQLERFAKMAGKCPECGALKFEGNRSAAEAELEQVKRNLTTWGIVELAVRNPNVAEYCKHWEGRTEAAELALAQAQAALLEFKNAVIKAGF